MSANITAPGYWLISSPKASGIVYYASPGQVSTATGAAFLGNTRVNQTNLRLAIDQLGLYGLSEVSPATLITQAEKTGAALLSQTPSGAVWDPTLTVVAAGLGASLYGAAAAAAGELALGGGEAAAGAAGAAGAEGAGEAAAGAGAGGAASSAASYALKGLSDLSSLAKAGGIAALLVDPSFLWRMVKIVGGLALGYVGVRQLAAAGGVV